MADVQLVLSTEEQELLRDLLETKLRETRVEAHHTRSRAYKEQVIHREDLIDRMLARLDLLMRDAKGETPVPTRGG